jgi:hypothetical protein
LTAAEELQVFHRLDSSKPMNQPMFGLNCGKQSIFWGKPLHFVENQSVLAVLPFSSDHGVDPLAGLFRVLAGDAAVRGQPGIG